MKIAIIGCGYVFDHYMTTAAAHQDIEIAAIWDIDPARLDAAARYYRLTAAHSEAELLADPAIALVVNLTSIAAHADVTRNALNAGKHVYCEKPLTTDLVSAQSLFDLAAEKGLMLVAAPCNLFSDSVQTMWHALNSGAIGRPLIAYAEFDDNPIYLMKPEEWRSRSGAPWPYIHEYEAGCTWEHVGYHLVWLCALFGPVESVTAFSRVTVPHKTDLPLHPADTPDFSVACLAFKSGMTARITCSIAVPQNHALRIIGDEGELSSDSYRQYQSPVLLERFTALSLNARKSRSVRRSPLLGSLFGAGGKRLRLLEFPWSHATRKGSAVAMSPMKRLVAAIKRREVGAQDKMLGVVQTVSAINNHSPPPVSPEFIMHITELTLAIQAAGTDGAAHKMTGDFPLMQPLAGALSTAADWRITHAPGLLARRSEKYFDRLHKH
ncbi:MAG: Gfo/Idh/MocA family oxidoreductase [Parasphingorhabdus sp.]|nr:Gfo/Idh/MocA family oxidoreductase [Parasphingorhabdus sp.]